MRVALYARVSPCSGTLGGHQRIECCRKGVAAEMVMRQRSKLSRVGTAHGYLVAGRLKSMTMRHSPSPSSITLACSRVGTPGSEHEISTPRYQTEPTVRPRRGTVPADALRPRSILHVLIGRGIGLGVSQGTWTFFTDPLRCASVAIVLRKTWKFSFGNPSFFRQRSQNSVPIIARIHESTIGVGKNEGFA